MKGTRCNYMGAVLQVAGRWLAVMLDRAYEGAKASGRLAHWRRGGISPPQRTGGVRAAPAMGT